MGDKNDNEKIDILNNKSISKYNSDKHRILSKSSAKKKVSGKSKPVYDVVSKKQLQFQNEINDNINDLNINIGTQRMLSNSVHLRNNKKEMRKTKSVEKKL